MIVPMSLVEVVGRREDLDLTLRHLQALGAVQLTAPGDDSRDGDEPSDPGAPGRAGATALTRLRERVVDLLALVPDAPQPAAPEDGPVAPVAAPVVDPVAEALADDQREAVLRDLEPRVAALRAERDRLRSEQESLPRFVEALGSLEPLVPELAELDDRTLAQAHVSTIALVLDDPDRRVVAELRRQLADLLGRRHLFVTTEGTRTGATVGCLLVLSTGDVPAVEELLGTDQITRVSVPQEFASRSLRQTVAGMRDELAAVPARIAALDERLTATVMPAAAVLRAGRDRLAATTERLAANRHLVLGERTFGLRAWAPRDAVADVRSRLAGHVPGPVVVAEGRGEPAGAPVLLRNPAPARPYERLVAFLSLPRPGAVDPTSLMALLLPFFFGVMVGDVVYGAVLAVVGWWIARRWAQRGPFVADLGRVLVVGGLWSIVFGFLFGEALGNFARYKFGFEALWFYRGAPEALTPLLLFVLGIGAAHIVLGLVLGVWSSFRDRHLRHAAERVGTLAVIVGLLGLAAVVVTGLPQGLLTPAVALMVVGLVIAVIAPGGAAGLLAPLELISAVGNVLSYLRLAAVGLASVYLAIVANELALSAPLLLGLVVATFFHVLNIALAAFSPMIQSLRLHYVEFFSKFHDGGGKPFVPFGAGLPPELTALPAPAPASASRAETRPLVPA
jgi:V/A-type H+-transporting ATPase subunit I